ncbi:unnamed protein product [Sphagnum balticum]
MAKFWHQLQQNWRALLCTQELTSEPDCHTPTHRSQYVQTDQKVLNGTAIIATTTMDDAQKVVSPQNQGCEGNEFSEVASTSGPSSKIPTCRQVSHERRACSICLTTDDRLRIGLSADELELKTEFDTIKKRFDSLPQVLQEIPHMNPCGVYANHNLRLARIHVYGFDYDYTLAHYTNHLQFLIYNLVKAQLVAEHRYPDSCLDFEYDVSFPIRGLYYDKQKGYLLKLDFFHSVQPTSCYFGRRKLSVDELELAYPRRKVSPEHMCNLVALFDLFCLSEVCLLADVIQHFVDQKLDFDCGYVYEDIQSCITHVHMSGSLHKAILNEPAKFLQKNNDLVKLLKMLKQRGKKLFVLTNSPFPFVDGGMCYLFQDFKGENWKDLFDVVVALAAKPNFYTSQRPFRAYNMEKDVLMFTKVAEFAPHRVYYHGCLKDFVEITQWNGAEVLYFGDHLYSDLRGPAKAGWRTAAIIRELEREITIQNQLEYRIQQARYNMVKEVLGRFHASNLVTCDEDIKLMNTLRDMRQNSRLCMKALFNENFGSTFLTDTGKESAFAYNVQRYADVYTSRLENFMLFSSDAWLYTPFDVKILPHHVKVVPSLLMIKQDEITQRYRL